MLTEKTYILCVLDILTKYSDPDHILTVKEILEKLKTIYDVSADRRTIYRNVDALIEFGYDISKYEENKTGYFLRDRDFEPSEIHMLCDAILTADCIPEKQGSTLMQKLQKLGSIYQTKCVNRLTHIKTDKKSISPEIFYNIDLLDEAITMNKQIEFDYYTYDLDLKLKPRRNKKYVANPYTLYWSNGQYYLLSNMDNHDGVTHFRLDRMRNLVVTSNPLKPAPKGFNAYEYASQALFMFGGETQTFTIKCEQRILNDVIDRFGERIIIQESGQDTFTAIVKATTGGMRLWATHYIETCQVISPQWLIDDMVNAIQRGMKNYSISGSSI
jgi:predicted DNA-binding transcriptional regulator YafY